ncbi:MAG TPA: S49 family peptidase [Chitinophagaceae bacterium]|nr:S49 family peptidase [Chitinophagaceae bacterium]
MQFNHTLSAILRGRWFINKAWADAHLPLIVAMLNGSPVSFVERTGNEGIEAPFALTPSTMQRTRIDQAKPGSVGILPISGPITKYNGECGEPGMIQRNSWLLQMQANPNIGSVVMLLDTPGGEASAAHTTTSTIKSFKKPILSYIDGMAASLGVWFTSATDEVYIGSELGEIGSVGSYCTLFDFTGYLEQKGIKMVEIYAPQSKDKNKDYRDALAGDVSAIEQDLKMHVDAFINSVATGAGRATKRGSIANQNKSAWSSGKMFYGKEAVKNGLADGIRPFDQVVSKAAWLAQRN